MADNDTVQSLPYSNAWEQQQSGAQNQPEGGILTGEGADPTHHIVLTDGTWEVGFVITDQSGQRNERTFRRFPQSDPVQPYVTEKQDSWGGGFGQPTFEDNRTKYWRSKGVDTTKDVLVLAPAFHFGKGDFRKADEYLHYDTFAFRAVHGSHAWWSNTFTPTQSWSEVTYIKLFLKKDDSNGSLPSLQVRLYTDSAGNPGTLRKTTTFTPDTITDPDGQWVRLAIPHATSYTTTTYHVVLTTSGGGKGRWLVGHRQSGTAGKKSTNGSSWTSTEGFYFRIEGPQQLSKAIWFDYKGQMYTMLQYDDNTDSVLYMNGWRGACDSNSGALGTLKDSTQTDWSAKITGDEVVQIVAGPTSALLDDRRTVASGVNGTLTMDNAWYTAHSVFDEYCVTNSDWFEQRVVSSVTGKVTDVATADGLAYFCRGGHRDILMYREYNNASGTWTLGGTQGIGGARAQFATTINDPISGDVVYFGYNRGESGQYKPYVWQSEPVGWADGGLDSINVGKNSASALRDSQYWIADLSSCSVSGTSEYAILTVTIGELTGGSVDAVGSGYNTGDIIQVVQSGSNGVGQFTVTAVAGEVTAVTPKAGNLGEDYVPGSNLTTTAITGSGTGCQVTITVTSVSAGAKIATLDLYDADDTQATYDVHNMTNVTTKMLFETKNKTTSITSMSTGDIELSLSAEQGGTNPFTKVDVIGLFSGRVTTWGEAVASLDIATTDGAQRLTAISMAIGEGITPPDKSFKLTISGEWVFYRSRRPVQVGAVDGDNITGMEAFGDPERLWCFTEAGYGQISNNAFLKVPMREIKVARHANNGSGHGVSDVYLLFTWRGRLQRYFRQNMEDLGPDFPAGMGDIAGEVASVVTYPGRVYVAIDGGLNGKSMILCYKGGGWHEVYTSFTGERIRSLNIQSIEDRSDKLWASVGSDLMWFPIALDSAELPDNTDYRYNPCGYIDSSWVYTGSRELDKLYRSIMVTVDDTTDTNLHWDVYYKIDDPNADWTRVTGSEEARSASTLEYFFTGATGNESLRGQRIRVRLHLWTNDLTTSPTVRSTQMRIYRIPEVKYSYTWMTKLSTISINLRGDEEKVIGAHSDVQSAFDKLDEWAGGLVPLRVRSTIATVKTKQVVLSPLPSQLLLLVPDEPIEEQNIQVQVNDI